MALRPYIRPSGVLTSWEDPFYDPLSTFFDTSLVPTTQSLSRLRNEATQPLTPLMSADLVESENDFHLHVDLPGVENLEINTDNQVLSISAERKLQHEQDTAVTHTRERSYGKVTRRLRIPANGDLDHATAKYRDGVLNVVIPKREQPVSGKKINIE